MLEEGAKRLAKFCRNQVGEKLRSVTVYRPQGTTRIYSDDELREQYTEAQLSTLVESAIELNATLHQTDIEATPLGRPQAGVYSFEEAFVIQWPWDETTGVVATFDADVGSSLAGFLTECRAVLDEDRPDRD